jgi:ribosomal protein L14E/L6E/L27E
LKILSSKLKLQIRNILREAIALDIEPGDVILTGRFKNKRHVVWDIGEDELGQPTINGRSILKFKIEKKLPTEKWSKKSRLELKETTRVKISKRKLKSIIREVLLLEKEDEISNADFAKELKSGASDIAGSVPAALNDELAATIKALTAMAQFDRSKFDKMVSYAEDLGAVALEKSQKGDEQE